MDTHAHPRARTCAHAHAHARAHARTRAHAHTHTRTHHAHTQGKVTIEVGSLSVTSKHTGWYALENDKGHVQLEVR